ncbi:MAG: hypothetical protein KJT01_15160, partial [Gemmatimonadetes bacterium]|nr:hypothetical protein [Gemmatimonadota bacterium]
MPRGDETPEERQRPLHLMDDDMDDLGYGSSYDEDEDEDDGYGIRSHHGESLWDSADDDEDEDEEEDALDDDLLDDDEDEDDLFGSAPVRRGPGR